MAKGGGSIHIDRAAEEVFAFVADAENSPCWRSYVVETTWLDDGPMRVGRPGRQVSKVLGRPMAVVAEIAVWDPPRHVTWRAIAGVATVRTDCTVEPGGCCLTITAEGEFASPVMRLLSPLAIAVASARPTETSSSSRPLSSRGPSRPHDPEGHRLLRGPGWTPPIPPGVVGRGVSAPGCTDGC